MHMHSTFFYGEIHLFQVRLRITLYIFIVLFFPLYSFLQCYYKDERVCSCCASVPQLEASFNRNAPANLDLANATAAEAHSRRISSHRPHPVTPPASSPRPGSYSPTYVAPETLSMSGRGNYAQVGYPPTPPAVARTVSTRSVSATGGDIPMATVVYA